MKLPRPRLLAVLAASVLFTVFLGIFLLPRLIDSRWIHETISSELQKKINGRVTFDKIAFQWFPRPAVQIDDAKFSIERNTEGSIPKIRIYPSIIAFLMGRAVVNRAVLEAPTLRIHLPAAAEKRLDLEELEGQIRSVLGRLGTDSPAPRIDLTDGTAELKIGDKPPVALEDIAIQIAASAGELQFSLSTRSNLCERATIEGNVLPGKLALRLAIGVQRLRIKESLALLPLEISEYASDGEASFDVKISAAGLRDIEASIDGSLGPFVVFRHGETATVEAKRIKGGIYYGGEVVDLKLEQLELGSPRLQASGEFKIRSDFLSALIEVRNADIGEVSHLALRLVDDPERLKGIMRYISGGTIPQLSFRSAGRSLPELARQENLSISGAVKNGKLNLPRFGLEIQNVSGSVQISGGILEARGISGTLGATRGWDGKLRLGLGERTAPFHLDLSLHTSAPQLHSVLLKLVRDEILRGELLKVRDVKGDLSGRLILGGTLDAVSPVVTVSKADIGATYEPIPFPIAIRSGRFNYDPRTIRLENAQGAVGRSTFAGLGATLHHDGSRRIKVDSGRISLNLQQTDALLRGFKDLRSHFEKLQSARGQIELQNLALAGTYDDPAGWIFASAGRFEQIEITRADFAGRIALSGGRFNAKQGQILFYDASAAMSDASLIASGTFEYQKGAPVRIETRGTATIGAQMTEWLSRHVELPKELKLRSPLKIAAERLSWRAGADASFLGQVTVSEGPQFAVDVVKQPDALTLRHLTIEDGGRRAQMTLQLAKHDLDFSFNGELTQQMLDRVFAGFPFQGSSLQGDFQATAVLQNPIRVSARGKVSGSNLVIPFGADKALLEKFGIEATGEGVQIRSADLLWGKSRVALSGQVSGAKEFLGLDLDVTGDRLDWEELERLFSRERRQKSSGTISMPDVQGTVRLKTDRFRFEGFDVSPVDTTVVIERSGIRTEIKRGVVCGIDTTGRVEFVNKEVTLDLQLSATNAQLEPTTICLTKRQNDITGNYSLTAHITGSGDRERLASTLKGAFELTARDGEFLRSPGIDAAFDYLNATGDFKVEFPDLDRETFPYRFVGIKGRIAGKVLLGDEVNVASSRLNLSGHGKVDLERKEIDGKGLIALLKPVDEVLGWIPLIGSVVGPSLLGIPVRVTGSLERPDITYLAPADVGAELLNMPLRILGMPLEALRLFTPSGAKPLNKDNPK